MNMMLSRQRILLFGCLICVGGCASDPSPQAESPAPVEPVIVVGPPVSAPDDTNTTESNLATSKQNLVAPTDLARTDGRPAWWIDQPQNASGRIYLSVEALGMDVRSARRAAVDSGIAALTRMLGHDPQDDRVHATTVRPLPHRDGSTEGMRYIGFVLVSAEVAE